MFRKLAGLTAVAGLFIAGTASAGVENSVHDFTDEITTNTELCGYCHVPHAADATVTDAPLWDHALSTKVYTPYSSTTMGATAMDGNTSTWGISRLCVSCHDGVTAIDSYGGGAASTVIGDVTAWNGVGTNYRGTDLSQEHPVSVPSSNDTLIKDPPDNAATEFFGVTNTVECASCHDVHDQANTSFLLVMDNTSSAMCLSCHDK